MVQNGDMGQIWPPMPYLSEWHLVISHHGFAILSDVLWQMSSLKQQS